MATRLQKYIASSGTISRRHAEELIAAGRVTVNGLTVKKMGVLVEPDTDTVAIDERLVVPAATLRYIAVYKPVGITSTRAQHKSEKTIYDLVPNARDLVIVGRLDKLSEGLVLLTNDGELTNRLTHPRYRHAKVYEVTTIKPLSVEDMAALENGVRLTEGLAKADEFSKIGPCQYRIVIHQGWKRQIRRMISAVHNDVKKLVRTELGNVKLGDLRPGQWRVVNGSSIL